MCVEVPVTLFRVYLGMVTNFWSTFVLGGGGGNVTFHGIYILFPAGITLLWVSVMHLWATLGCGVFSCHSNLVWPVRGSLGAASMKSVAHRPLCA